MNKSGYIQIKELLEKDMSITVKHNLIMKIVGNALTNEREEKNKLRALCRYQHLTLGFYGTAYNYDKESIYEDPKTRKEDFSIMHDAGKRARDSREIMEKLGFSQSVVHTWEGVFKFINGKPTTD